MQDTQEDFSDLVNNEPIPIYDDGDAFYDPNDYFYDLEIECEKSIKDHTIVVPSSITPIDDNNQFFKFNNPRDVVPFVQGIDPSISFRLKSGFAVIRLTDLPKLRLPRNPKEQYPVLVYLSGNSNSALEEIYSLF